MVINAVAGFFDNSSKWGPIHSITVMVSELSGLSSMILKRAAYLFIGCRNVISMVVASMSVVAKLLNFILVTYDGKIHNMFTIRPMEAVDIPSHLQNEKDDYKATATKIGLGQNTFRSTIAIVKGL
ncbi:hypothetical protein BCR43DRAFT_507419 [Syncephalastrum racemosum]|uniref:Uncharacterized protein n=1 Tax=Syncephalastrum racemosum TaxID=13706 RepID=A0A1X2H746_SYNRA|nr:hypothetical protein BCR43DRAFT_507419 [Syncephalastrum racemosum]